MKEQQNLHANMGNLNTINTDFNSLLNMSEPTIMIIMKHKIRRRNETEPKSITQSLRTWW